MDVSKRDKTLPIHHLVVNKVNSSKAVYDIGEKPDKWTLDCGQFALVSHWYALLHALGDDEFNKRYPKLVLSILDNDGGLIFKADASGKVSRLDGKPETRTMDQIVAAAPIGARVAFTNPCAKPGDAFLNENTRKVGPDLYAGQGTRSATGSRADIADDLIKYTPGCDPNKIYISLVQIEDLNLPPKR